MKHIAPMVMILLGGCATANLSKPIYDTPWPPPARYDHPYDGLLIEYPMPQGGIDEACAELTGRKEWTYNLYRRGCSIHSNGKCEVIYIDKTWRGVTPAEVRRHEVAHCNGWGVSHEP